MDTARINDVPVRFEHLSQDALDRQLSPSQTAKDFAGVLRRHETATAALEKTKGLRVVRNVAYGSGARQRLDVCRPEFNARAACVVFIHGGFWQEGSIAGSGFAAAQLAALGFAHVALGYTLAPQARLREIIGEVSDAVAYLRAHADTLSIDAERLVLAGHSAGAHLAAAMVAGIGGDDAARGLAGAVLISGVYDLAPIAASYVNDALGIEGAEIYELSPVHHRPLSNIPIDLLIGADEPDAFQAQTKALHKAWAPHLCHLNVTRVAGRDHFDILDELATAVTGTAISEARRR